MPRRQWKLRIRHILDAIDKIRVYILYSAYCRKGWGGRVRQNLPPGHANFNRRLFLTTLAIKRSEPFSKLHENRP